MVSHSNFPWTIVPLTYVPLDKGLLGQMSQHLYIASARVPRARTSLHGSLWKFGWWSSTILWTKLFNFIKILASIEEIWPKYVAQAFWLKLLFPRFLIKIFIYSFPPAYAPLPHFPPNSCYYFSQSFYIGKLFGMTEWHTRHD